MEEYGPSPHYWTLFTSPLTWSIVLLSITAVLYISSVFLTWYANQAKDESATNLMRIYALDLGSSSDHYSRRDHC